MNNNTFQISLSCLFFLSNDLCLFSTALSSCAHMKSLVRTKQSQFTLEEHTLHEEQWTLENVMRTLQPCPDTEQNEKQSKDKTKKKCDKKSELKCDKNLEEKSEQKSEENLVKTTKMENTTWYQLDWYFLGHISPMSSIHTGLMISFFKKKNVLSFICSVNNYSLEMNDHTWSQLFTSSVVFFLRRFLTEL